MGLADLTTGGRAGQLAERAGVRFKDAKNVLTDLQSDEQKAADLEVQKADGFVPTVRAMVRNPSTIANAVAESAPSMIVGGAAARGLMRAGALRSPIAAGAAGEGIVTAGQNAEQVRQETATGTLTPQQAAVLAGSGLATGAISLAGGKLANKLGIGDVDTMLASGKLGPVGPAAGAPKGALRRIGEGAVSEGVLQEAPQSYQEQVAQNVALGKPWDEGAASAAAAGMLVGGVTGAAGNVLAGSPQAPVQPPPAVAPTTPPAAPAAPPASPAAPADQVGANLTPSVGAIPNGEVLPLMPAEQAQKVDYSRPAVTRARAMGINPDRGPLSAAAAIAVNNGATDVVQRQQLEADAAEELKNTPKPAGAVRKSAEAPKKKAEPPPPPRIERTGGPLSAAVFSLPSTTTGASDAPDPEAQQGPAAGQQPGAATDPAAAGGTGIPAEMAAGAAPDEAVAGAAAAQGPTDLTGGATNAQDQGQAGGQEAGTQPAASAPGAPEPVQPAAGPELLPQAQEQQQPDAPATVDPDTVGAAAHQAATSPMNDLPQPTEGQQKAGNYKLGHLKWRGLDLSFENPKGSQRSGVDPSGKAWSVTMPAHYGYFKRTEGADGDHVDFYMGDHPESERVFVIDQQDADTKKWDEHKVILGATNILQAIRLYDKGFSDGRGRERRRAVTAMTVEQFRTWLRDGDTTKPISEAIKEASNAGQTKARAQSDPNVQTLAQREGPLQQSEQPVLPQLRGPGDNAASGVAAQLPGVQKGSGATPDATAQPGSDQQRSTLPAGQSAVGDQAAAGKEPTQERPDDTQRSDAASGSVGASDGVGSVNAALPDQSGRDDAPTSTVDTEEGRSEANRKKLPFKRKNDPGLKEANTTAARKAKQAEIFTALVGDQASVGQDEAAITQRVKDGLGLTELTDAQVQKLAASVVKEVAKRAIELEKQKHRIPAVREAAIAAAIAERYKADDLTTEQHSAFIAGFDHALAGKTKSTLAGDYLDHRQAGYAAASKWIKTEEGAAWYEGRPVNKLENTGVDLRRWWEKLRENMKADESDIAKAWAQIERATARADLFAPLLAKPNMTPGHTLYITEFRSNVRPFKDWLQEQHDRWYGDSKSRWDDTDKSNIDYILEGGRYPYSLSEKDRQKWETDSAYRATWLRAAADKYLTEVRSLISFFDGTNTLKEAIDAFTAKFTDPEKSAKFLEKPSERGEAATTLKDEYRSIASNWRGGPFWLESINVFAKFRGHTPWTDKLLLDENAQSLLPTTAKPLTPPKLDRVTRDGANVRAGKDVTPAEVKARFGLADVGFGKWVGAKQDQDHLNYAHDAFMDLAKFLGIKPEAIGLNGMHFTIGALGHGKFAAHFHPAQPHPDGGHVQVINVTNTRGDGTVAHEWFHALDHNLGGDWKNSVRPQFLAFLKRKALTVERVEAEARKFLVGGWFWPDNKKMPKPEAAIRALRQYSAGVVNDSATAYKSNADALGKDYWGNNEELIARASEAYVGDKLGFKNTYLVNPAWSGDGAVTKDKGYRGTPYPTGEERAFFNEIFDALIKSIKWEGGKPTVTRKDFEANLPGVIKAGETRRQALLDHAAMIELHESFLREQQERIDEIERERAEAKRAKQAELDRLAQEKIDQMKPPKEPEAPPPAVVDGPNEPPAGALSDADLEHLFDQAAAELQEAQQETPDRPVPDEAPAATAAAWTQADLDEMMAAQDKAGAAGIATAEKIEGLPTIHELGAMGKTTFLGDGFFETTGYGPAPDVRTLGKPWRMTWSGGGAMRSTSSGKSYTLVQMSEGARPFTMSVQKAMEAVGSLKAPATTPQPVGESDLVRRARERLEAGKPAPLDAGIVRTADNKRAEASATALIAEATKLGVKGASEALTGLAKLFGGSPGRLNSFGAGFDEETYQKAKPHFKEALAAFQAAGKTLKDLFKLLISQFGDGIKEYAIRFAKDEGLTAQLGAAPPKPQGVSVAAEVQRRLAAGQALTWQELFDLADKQFGGTQAEGKYTPKDAYDAVEAGVNRYLMDSGQFSPNATRERALEVVTQLQAMMALLPTQTKRTAEMDQYQQFSTVPPFAFVANWVANIQPGDVMMEPSAGIGGLAVFAKNAGAKLVLNELSSRRAEVLQSVFPEAKVFREDAEQIHNILPDSVKPTVVVMNPPFSSAAERGIKNTMVGAAHVEQALARLPDGGRLVAIVGEGMGLDKPAFKAWWAKMRSQYDVRAVVPVDGKGYAKYGTTFDNVLLVIDKVPSIGREPIAKQAADYGELIGLLAEVRDGRPAARVPVNDRPGAQPDRDQPTGDQGTGAGPGGDLAAGAGAGPATGVGPGQSGQGPGLGNSGSGRGGSGRGGRSPGNVQQPGAGKTGTGADAAASGAGDALDGGGSDSTPQAGTSGVTITGAATAPAAALTDSVFEGYQPQRLQVAGAKPHPGPLVQSAAMASVLPPAATYVPNLPSATVTQGKLSIAQIESVVYAGQAHNQWVEINVTPDQQKRYGLAEGGNVKYRRGFFIGDGTGVGKGREISGILLDNLRQGRKKAVWVSEKQGLLNDAKRDFGGVGGDADLLFNQNETTADGKVPSKNGIIFTTYSTLRSGTAAAKPATAAQLAEKYPPGSEITLLVTPRNPDDPPVEFRVKMDSIEKRANKMWVLKGPYDQRVHVPLDKVVSINGDTNWAMAKTKAGAAQSRIDQLVDWLGPDFDGVIAFDEAHNAGNATAIKTERGMTDPSAQALAVVDLQMRLPKARVVYVSATGATEVSNLSFANRLGLWGPGTPFSGVEHFVAEMTAGGLATMELVARDMKQSGMYLARSLSYDGVTYSRADHNLTEVQREMYDRMADGWQVVLKNMMAALELTGATKDGKSQKNNAKSAAKAAFWGGQQRFFNQVITSMQMPTVLDGMERDLQAGKAVVVQLVNTNEAQQERALAKRKEEGEEDLEDLDLTPMDQLIQLVTKSFPVQQYVTKKDSEGRTFSEPAVDSQGNPILNKAAVALRDKLLKDLEGIRDAVPDGPLEMLLNHFGPDVVAEVTGRKQRVVRKPDADGNVKATLESRGSAAARADAEAFMADRKRILVFSDAGGTGFSFQADLTKKNQRQRAHYLVQPGWRANKAVQGLGRTHRTNQASAPEYVLAATDIPAHKRFLSSIARRLDQLGALTKGQRDTSSGGLFSEKDNLESKYAVEAVKHLFADIEQGQVDGIQTDEFLEQMGLEDIRNPDTGQINESKVPGTAQFLNRLLSLRLSMQETVFNAFIVRMEEAVELAAKRGLLDTGMQTIRALETKVLSEEVVYVDERTGAETTLVDLEATQATRFYEPPDPVREGGKDGKGFRWMVNVKSGRVWGVARSGTTTKRDGSTERRYRMMGTNGMSVRTESEFKPGSYKEISQEDALAMWAKENEARPPTYTTRHYLIVGSMLPIWDRLKTNGTVQVKRTQTSDGRRLLGREIPAQEVAEVRKRLNLESAAARMTPAQVMEAVLRGEAGVLANGWRLSRSLVSGDLRIELTRGRAWDAGLMSELKGYGLIAERIQWQDRMFVPVGEAGIEAMGKLLKAKPLTDILAPEKKKSEDDDAQFARGNPFYSALAREVERIPAKAQGGLGWVMNITGLVKAGKVKADEVEWSGLTDWLRMQQGKVTREQVLQYLATNGVQVTETTLGGDAQAEADFQEARDAVLRELEDLGYEPLWINEGTTLRGVLQVRSGREFDVTDSWEDADAEDAMQRLDDILQTRDENLYVVNDERALPKYKQYQLPGGTNYREVLLTLPSTQSPAMKRYVELGDLTRALTPSEQREYNEARAAALLEVERGGGGYRSNHWDQPNVLAHIRVNDRTDADGKRVLFVEELQSDWSQAGHKKTGNKLPDGGDERVGFRLPFTDKVPVVRGEQMSLGEFLSRNGAEAQRWLDGENAARADLGDRPMGEADPVQVIYEDVKISRVSSKMRGPVEKWAETIARDWQRIRATERQQHAAKNADKAPAAPFVTKTDAWVALALKRIIKMAADEGYDRVAFISGEQSADRYDLSKHIDRIHYEKADNGKYELIAYRLGSRDDSTGSEALHEDEVDIARIEELVGKEIAQKIADDAGESIGGPYRNWRELKGVDLKVGGEGMRAFYDQIVPATLKDVLRKVGGGGLYVPSKLTEPDNAIKHYSDLGQGREAAVAALKPVVDSGVVASLQNDKIAQVVVEALPVNVVNMLADQGIDAKKFTRDPKVLIAKLPVDRGLAVANGLRDALSRSGARLRAGLNAARKAGLDLEVLPAVRAGDIDTDVAARILFGESGNSGSAIPDRRAGVGLGRAGAGAEASAVAPRLGGVEGGAAALAGFVDWHRGIVSQRGGDLVLRDAPQFDITPAMREKAADGLPLFDRQQALQRNPMDAQRVRDIVAPIAQKWDVEVRVVDTPADLPVPAPADALGLHLNGVIYLVASTNRSKAQVQRTLAHEAVAHYGLRSMLGREGFRAFVNQVQFAARARPGPLREVSDYIRRTYVDQDGVFNLTPAQEGDEIAARVVELGVDPISGEFKPGFGMLKAVFSKVAEFLRSLGIPVRFTNAELQGMLVRSMRRLQAGRPLTAAMTAQASMSRAPGFYFDAKSSPLYKQRTAQAAGAISEAQAREALATDAVARRIMAKGIEVQEGDRVGARLNINVLKNTGVAVNTIHRGKAGDGYTKNRGWWGGEVIAYAPVVTLRDAYFNVDQRAREGIASGAAAKSPMASIDGAFRKEHSFDGVEFRFNPKREHLFRDALGRVLKRADEVTITGNSAFARGEIEYYGPEDVPARAGDAPSQGRLLEPGDDSGEASFARIGSAQTLSDVTDKLRQAVEPIGTVSLWDKTVGTQFNKATKDRDFKRVFDAYLQQTDDTAHYAIEAERNAPDILMRLDNVVDAAKALWHSGPKHKRDLEAVSRALFANIEGQTGVQSVRYDELSLRQIHGLNDRQIAMYYQARAAVDTSIERLAQTYAAQIGAANGLSIDELKNMALDDTVAMVKTHIQETHDGLRADEELRREVMAQDQDEALDRARQLGGFPAAPTVDETRVLLERLDKIEEKARFLQEAGYMPAMRFGEYAVTVTDPETNETLHFEMFESQTATNLAAMRLRREYPDGMIEKSVMNPEQYRMFKGVSPETVELFAQFTGADQSEAYQRYIALAKSARNVKMRELKRKGIAGFSEDATRVLASFVTSNARQAAINMNVDEITAAMASKSLAAKGDVQREAQKLHEYMANPLEEARRLRGFMFLHFLGGSVASALVNLTQPMLQTAPYLSQYAGSRTSAIMARAARMAASGNYDNPTLRAAAERAAAEGITEPHEIHQLMADASGSSFGSNLQARAAVKLWGSLFSNAESFNRRITFIAAYQVALETGQSDPYAFARRAVYETQGIYSKVNRPNWARGGVGATLFTFKQFTISYLEWWRRLPKREKVLAFAILVLAAGTEGLPFMDDIEDLIDTIGQTLGYNTNSKKAIRHAMVDTLGKTAGTMLNTGLLSMSGVDVSGRLGLGNLLPGTAMFKPSETDKSRTVSEFAGPLGGLVQMGQKAVQKAQAGDIFGRTGAVAQFLPKAVRDVNQGLDMLDTGIYKDTRGYKVSDVTAAESWLKMLGLQPESVASKTRRLSDEIQDKGMVTMMEAMIADRWAAGLAEKDPAKVQAARDALAAWNRNNPETPIRIKPMQITRRVREINRTREERFLRTAPKEMRGAAARELAS